jgi:hypothetical protein
MPTNTQQLAGLVAQPVPPDRECVRNLTEILLGVQDFMQVLVNVFQSGGSTDSVAQQALEVANAALATAQQALAATPNRRTSGVPLAVPAGDSVMPISWSPAMPDADYEVRGTYYGTNVAVAAFYNFRVIDGSRTVNGCQIRFDNTPAATKFAWTVEAL